MSTAPPPKPAKRRSPTYFFLRGVAIILPPILTLLILLWVANGFNSYVIQPINTVVRYAVAKATHDIRQKSSLKSPPPNSPSLPDWQHNYRVTKKLEDALTNASRPFTAEMLLSEDWDRHVCVPMGNTPDPNEYVPIEDYNLVFKQLRPLPPPTTAIGLYMEIAAVKAFRTSAQLSAVALSITIIALYFLGRFVTARIGSWFVHKFEYILTQVPFVRNVYSTVKQVTDFVFSEREVEFRRVVAVEYPRAGAWTVGFATGEGILDVASEIGEPMVSVLVPTSPMPAGGFTIIVPKSSVIDLDMTVDQAVQFIVSCGVLTPPTQRVTAESLQTKLIPAK